MGVCCGRMANHATVCLAAAVATFALPGTAVNGAGFSPSLSSSMALAVLFGMVDPAVCGKTRHAAAKCSAGSRSRGCSASSSSGAGSGAAHAFRAVRQLLSGVGRFSRRLLELRSLPGSEGSYGLFLRRSVKAGSILIELPLSRVLWRGTADLSAFGIELPNGAVLSDSDRLILLLTALHRLAGRGENAGTFEPYGQILMDIPVPNSTLFWAPGELQWLRGTEAGDVSEYLLGRTAQIHAAAPLAASLEELQVASAHFHLRHFQLWLGGNALFPDRMDVALLPGIDLCRSRDGALRPTFNAKKGVVRLMASQAMAAGDEVFVDRGQRDLTDLLVASGVVSGPDAEDAGLFLPVPLERDENGGAKARLLEQLQWPAEVRLVSGQVEDLKVLRLAAMPREEFSAWSVGALVAGAPLAVSRAFRTEIQAAAFLVTDCARRSAEASAQRPSPSSGTSSTSLASARFRLALEYREAAIKVYDACREWALDRLMRLRRWATRQEPWRLSYADEALHLATLPPLGIVDGVSRQPRLLDLDPHEHLALGVNERMVYSSIVALVNSKAREFAPYFDELLKAKSVTVEGSVGVRRRLQKIKRLALNVVQLKGPVCGGVDLSAFDWINDLRGEEEVFTTLWHLLPETDDLVREFAQLERLGEAPAWR